MLFRCRLAAREHTPFYVFFVFNQGHVRQVGAQIVARTQSPTWPTDTDTESVIGRSGAASTASSVSPLGTRRGFARWSTRMHMHTYEHNSV